VPASTQVSTRTPSSWVGNTTSPRVPGQGWKSFAGFSPLITNLHKLRTSSGQIRTANTAEGVGRCGQVLRQTVRRPPQEEEQASGQ